MHSGRTLQAETHRMKPGPSDQEKVTAEIHTGVSDSKVPSDKLSAMWVVMRVLEPEREAPSEFAFCRPTISPRPVPVPAPTL